MKLMCNNLQYSFNTNWNQISLCQCANSRDISVDIAPGYWLDGQEFERRAEREGNFSLPKSVQTALVPHAASSKFCREFPRGVKRAREWIWPPSLI